MKSTIFVPKTIKVGYQERRDTYTGQLAYIVYYDQKGVLRKESSWESWRDKKIDPQEFTNEPTSGFVLNKKAGGYSTGWNHRQTYVRVYDPRGFEFEISIPNLLYILENTNSIKGKGLEGEFVYGWDRTDLVLIPVSSPDYVEISNFNAVVSNPETIKVKELVLGGTYLSNSNQEWIYLGRFEKYDDSSWRDTYGKPEGLKYFFKTPHGYEMLSSMSKRIIKTISTEPVSNYAEIMEDLESHTFYSPVDVSKDEYIVLSLDELKAGLEQYGLYAYMHDGKEYKQVRICKDYYRNSNNVMINLCNTHRNDRIDSWHVLSKQLDSETDKSIENYHNKYQFMKKVQYLVNGRKLK